MVGALFEQRLHRAWLPAVEEVPVEAVADPVVEGINQLVSSLEVVLCKINMVMASPFITDKGIVLQ